MVRRYFCIMKYIVWIVFLFVGASSSVAQISDSMKRMIKEVEGLETVAYLDGSEVAVGYGHHVSNTEYDWIRMIQPGDEITTVLAELLFDYDMLYLVSPGLASIRQDIGMDYPSNVYDVMGSLIYNVGLSGLKQSNFYKLFCQGNYEKAFTALLMLKSRDKGVFSRRKKELRILLENYDFDRRCYR